MRNALIAFFILQFFVIPAAGQSGAPQEYIGSIACDSWANARRVDTAHDRGVGWDPEIKTLLELGHCFSAAYRFKDLDARPMCRGITSVKGYPFPTLEYTRDVHAAFIKGFEQNKLPEAQVVHVPRYYVGRGKEHEVCEPEAAQ